MTTHNWNSNVVGYMFDPANYADGQGFAPGDTLVVASGRPVVVGVDQLGVLTVGSYLFAGSASVEMDNIELPPGGILGESTGPQFDMFTFGQFVNAGSFDIGSATQAGSVEDLMDRKNVAASFTNAGQITLQDGSLLRLYPSSASNVVNASGAVIDVDTGSTFVFSDLDGYLPGSGNAFTNDGLIAVSAATGGSGSAVRIGANYAGDGTLSVAGTSGANPTYSFAELEGSATGNFDVASGELQFDGEGAVQGNISFYDGDGLLHLESSLSYPGAVPYAPLQATINHFEAGDQIFLDGSVLAQSFAYDQASHELRLFSASGGSGAVVAQLTLAGAYTTGDFQVATPGSVDGLAPSAIYSALITTTSTVNGSLFVAPGGSFGGDNGNPVITTEGNATVTTGTGASDVLLAGGANLVVSHGSDTVSSSTGSDTVFASGGAVVDGGGTSRLTFVGGTGADTVSGGAGMLTVFGAAAGGVYTAGSGGRSVLVATAGNTTLTGGANYDAMYGSTAGGDVLQAGNEGGGGFDYLVAAGSATLQNGNGNTVMYGGTGADLFSFSGANAGIDWVVGFRQGTDRITLGGTPAASVLQGATFSGAGTTFTLGGSQVTVFGVHLAASDFG